MKAYEHTDTEVKRNGLCHKVTNYVQLRQLRYRSLVTGALMVAVPDRPSSRSQ